MEQRIATSYHGKAGGSELFLFITVALAECQLDTASMLGALSRQVEQAYEDVDDDAFEAAYHNLQLAVDCVRSPLHRNDLLLWHRATALGKSWERERIASGKSWAAVKILDPLYHPPDSWMPDGSALRRAWEEAPMSAERVQLERVPAGGWYVDGQRTNAVPTARAFILQGFDASGDVVHTDYHYGIAEIPIVDFIALDPTLKTLRNRRVHAAGTTVTLAMTGAAITSWILAARERKTTLSIDTPALEVQKHADRTSRLSNTSVGLGLAAIATLTTTWTVRW